MRAIVALWNFFFPFWISRRVRLMIFSVFYYYDFSIMNRLSIKKILLTFELQIQDETTKLKDIDNNSLEQNISKFQVLIDNSFKDMDFLTFFLIPSLTLSI